MGLSGQVSIYATDVSRAALEKARQGIYRSWSLRGIEEWPGAARFFERRLATGEYRLARQICEMVTFREANLASLQPAVPGNRSEEHTSELQSLMRTPYAVFCLKKQTKK